MKKLIALALAAGLCLAGWLVWHPHRDPQPLAERPAATASPLPSQDTQRLQQALDSPDRQTQAASLQPDARRALLAQAKPLVPAHATLALQPSTFRYSGQVGMLEAQLRVPGQSAQRYTLIVTRQTQDSPWLILTTVRK